jgi:DNA-binding PadR family transcriptional regulator
MPRHKKDDPKLKKRQSSGSVLVNEAPLGFKEALCMRLLMELGDDAYGLKVLELLSEAAGEHLDSAEVYGTLRRLMKDKKLISVVDTRKSEGGPPFKIYAVNADGRKALEVTLAHHRAIVDFLSTSRT